MAGLGMYLISVTVPTARGSAPHVMHPPIVYGGLAIWSVPPCSIITQNWPDTHRSWNNTRVVWQIWQDLMRTSIWPTPSSVVLLSQTLAAIWRVWPRMYYVCNNCWCLLSTHQGLSHCIHPNPLPPMHPWHCTPSNHYLSFWASRDLTVNCLFSSLVVLSIRHTIEPLSVILSITRLNS